MANGRITDQPLTQHTQGAFLIRASEKSAQIDQVQHPINVDKRPKALRRLFLGIDRKTFDGKSLQLSVSDSHRFTSFDCALVEAFSAALPPNKLPILFSQLIFTDVGGIPLHNISVILDMIDLPATESAKERRHHQRGVIKAI